MDAFISYSHQDSQMLDLFHKHLAQLQREELISTWTDREIFAGGSFNDEISVALENANLFIALLSPDYIASNYCYEKEFKRASEMQKQSKLIIIPIILEPCDWLNTPFKDFKALPLDGKPVSNWENKNTAFLNVIQNIRKLIDNINIPEIKQSKPIPKLSSINYRVQKDFDSIEKMEFIDKSFNEIKEYLKRFIDEITQLDNIKTRILTDNNKVFECLLVNRNKIATESHLKISINSEKQNSGIRGFSEGELNCSISINSKLTPKNFKLAFDEYHLYWIEIESTYYYRSESGKELSLREKVDNLWN